VKNVETAILENMYVMKRIKNSDTFFLPFYNRKRKIKSMGEAESFF
jgi:hypothetical protein